jgi:hypothetical protein
MNKWLASQYLDTNEWGVLDEQNHIILRLRLKLTEEQAKEIAEAHNYSISSTQIGGQE